MRTKSFTLYDTAVSFISLFSFVVDVGSDVLLIAVFFTQGHYIWGSLALAFVALATFLMQIFSFCWHATDKNLNFKVLLAHALFLAPLHRYIDVIRLGFKARKTRRQEDVDAVFRANNDICLLRLIESFTESAPQLVLQLYIILRWHEVNWVIGLSTLLSLASLAWAMTAYTDGLRLAYKDPYNRKWLGLTVYAAWQIAMISSRVTAMVVFSTVYQAWVFLAVGIHWCFMTAWITLQNADFGETPCEKRLFNSVAGFIHIFCFLNLKDSRARWRLLAYHIITVIENSLLILLWFFGKEPGTPIWLEITTVVVVFGGFVAGGLFMVMYYCCCHPTGPKPSENKQQVAYWFRRLSIVKEKVRDPIFDEPDVTPGRVTAWLNASLNLSRDAVDDHHSVSTDPGGRKNTPDIQYKLFGNTRMLNSSHTGNTTNNFNHSYRGPSPSTTIESDGASSFMTKDSGKASYISASSTRHLLFDSQSNISHISNDKSYNRSRIVMLPRSIGREDFSLRGESHNNSQLSSSGIELDKSRVSSNSSSRMFCVSNGLDESIMSHSNFSKSRQSYDSFYSSPEYKTGKISPLDARQLWEESQNRLASNKGNQTVTIVTRTNVDNLSSHTSVTWNKDSTGHPEKSLHGEYDESQFNCSASYLNVNHTKTDHNYALSNTSRHAKNNDTSNSGSHGLSYNDSSINNNSQGTSYLSSVKNSPSVNNGKEDSYFISTLSSSGPTEGFSDESGNYNNHVRDSYSFSSENNIGSSYSHRDSEDSPSYTSSNNELSYSSSARSYSNESERSDLSNSHVTTEDHAQFIPWSPGADIPYADDSDSSSEDDNSHETEDQSLVSPTSVIKDNETSLSDWFGDISSMHQSKPDISRFWVSGVMNGTRGSASRNVSRSVKVSNISDLSYEASSTNNSSSQYTNGSSVHQDSSISLYQYGNSYQAKETDSESSYQNELRRKSSQMAAGYYSSRNDSSLSYGRYQESSRSAMSSCDASCTPSAVESDQSRNSAQQFISPILSEAGTDDSGYHRSKSTSGGQNTSDSSDFSISNSNQFSGSDNSAGIKLSDGTDAFDMSNRQRPPISKLEDQIVPDEDVMLLSIEESPRRKSLPGLSYLHSDVESFHDNYNGHVRKQTPLKLKDIEASPNRFGRNVDLFKARNNVQTNLQSPDRDNRHRKNKFTISQLVESPYKFGQKQQSITVSQLTESPYKFRSKSNTLPLSQLVESQYKFRSRKSDPIGNKHLQNKTHSKQNHHDKENNYPQTARSRRSCPSQIQTARHRFKELETGGWEFQQETDIDSQSIESDEHYVPSFRYKGVKRKATDQLDIPVTKPCYVYSSDEEPVVNDSDMVVPGYINTDVDTPGYGNIWRSDGSKSGLSVSQSDLQRPALKALQNTPGFSPILVPEEMERVQNSASHGRVVKPIVSTPRLATHSYSGSYQQLVTLQGNSSTVDV